MSGSAAAFANIESSTYCLFAASESTTGSGTVTDPVNVGFASVANSSSKNSF